MMEVLNSEQAQQSSEGDELEDDGGNLEEEIIEVLDDRPMKVHQGLYIGSYMAEMNKKALIRAGITDILQVAQGLFPHHPLMFNYMNLQVQDMPGEDMVQYFPKCFEFMDRAINTGGAVLVHCAAGVSRSATVVLGYLMTHHHMGLATALEHLKDVRPWVCPNTGFLKQLEAFQALSLDFSKWRPWHLVWQQQQQQHDEQQQQQQQQWLQVPQVQQQLVVQPKQQQQQQQLQLPQHVLQEQQQHPVGTVAPASGTSQCVRHSSGSNGSSSGCGGASSSAGGAPGSSSSSSSHGRVGASWGGSPVDLPPSSSASTPAVNISTRNSSRTPSGVVGLHHGPPELDPWAQETAGAARGCMCSRSAPAAVMPMDVPAPPHDAAAVAAAAPRLALRDDSSVQPWKRNCLHKRP